MTEDNSEKNVKLFKQTYQEFASQGLEERLEPIGIVVGAGNCENLELDLLDANYKLSENALRLGATHVFGIEYHCHHGKTGSILLAYGDAYKPKKDKNGPYR